MKTCEKVRVEVKIEGILEVVGMMRSKMVKMA